MSELFQDELKKLRGRFMEMGFNVSEQIYQSTKSFTDHNVDLAQEVIKTDNEINSEESDLEQRAMKLMALQQPVASEFRIIISILKASTDLERIGDHAISIARETIRERGNPRIPEVEENLTKMTKQVRKMLEQVLDAYQKDDVNSSINAAQEDLKIDNSYEINRKKITKEIQKDAKSAKSGASYLMVNRLLERIGDHTVNLAEWNIYSDSGKIVELNYSDDGEDKKEK